MELAESGISIDVPPTPLPPARWNLAAAQQRGTSHEMTGKVCQDVYGLAMLSPEILIMAIADGAGSAKYAEVGAGVAVSKGIEELCARLDDAGDAVDETALKDILYAALSAAKTAVEAEAGAQQVSAQDLAATLILVIVRPDLVAAAQVGDGATVIADESGKIIGLTLPPLEEYINETTFITSAEALRTAQMLVWRGRAARLAALSDGLQLLCLKWPERLPHEAFFAPLFHFIGNPADEIQADHVLANFLSSEKIKELTDDDLTLVLASLKDDSNGL